MANQSISRKPEWLNKSRMADSLGITTQAFDKWGVTPVAKIGRESFYDVRSVLDTPYVEQEQGFGIDGVTSKVRIDAGVAPRDYRGLNQSTGK